MLRRRGGCGYESVLMKGRGVVGEKKGGFDVVMFSLSVSRFVEVAACHNNHISAAVMLSGKVRQVIIIAITSLASGV